MVMKIKIVVSFMFLLKFSDQITFFLVQLENVLMSYFEELNREPDMVIKA